MQLDACVPIGELPANGRSGGGARIIRGGAVGHHGGAEPAHGELRAARRGHPPHANRAARLRHHAHRPRHGYLLRRLID